MENDHLLAIRALALLDSANDSSPSGERTPGAEPKAPVSPSLSSRLRSPWLDPSLFVCEPELLEPFLEPSVVTLLEQMVEPY